MNKAPKFPMLNELAQGMIDRVCGMSEERVRQLADECRNVGPTNCWWATYETAKLVKDTANFQVGLADARKAEQEEQ